MSRRSVEQRRSLRGLFCLLVGGVGEIVLTLGMVLLLFVAWQLWWTNLEAAAVQNTAVTQVAQDWKQASAGTSPIEGDVWGILYVPRFGNGYAKPIAEGVDFEVLDTIGVGRYLDTQRPGQLGNIGLAGHRQTHGQVFWDMDKLVDGDKAYIQTAKGIFTYAYEGTKVVYPSQGDVVFPVPGEPGAVPTRKLLTLTTCHPPFTTNMRMIVHLEQTGFTPAAKSAPVAIRTLVARTTGVGKE